MPLADVDAWCSGSTAGLSALQVINLVCCTLFAVRRDAAYAGYFLAGEYHIVETDDFLRSVVVVHGCESNGG